MATLYREDGSLEHIAPANGASFSLEELQALVGGWIELVYTHDGRPMIIDEEGKIKNRSVNIPASRLYHNGFADPIVGAALVCSPEEFGTNEDD